MHFRHLVSCFVLFVASILLLAMPARATEPMRLAAKLAYPVMQSGERQQNYLRIGLNGCEPQRSTNRTPVNVAFVIDRSGSMDGARIAQARAAAIMAIKRLGPDDIASLVIFDDKVDVILPAQNLTAPDTFVDEIRRIGVRGTTAIYAGVKAGADEVRKFKDPRRLNRVVLLSDGLANVGPSRPEEFGALGRTLLKEGISVSTIGLGASYNEDLMLQLARASDGNHAFASAPTDLIQIFNREFDDVLASCAQMVSIDVDLKPGVRLVRAISRDGEVQANHGRFELNQIYAATEHYVLLELAFDGATPADEQEFGRVQVAYTAPDTGARQTIEAPVRGRFSESADEPKAQLDRSVMDAVVEQTTRERAEQAVALRDRGLSEEARKLFAQNASELQAYLAQSKVPVLGLLMLSDQYNDLAKAAPASPSQWNQQRKALRQLNSGAASVGTRY